MKRRHEIFTCNNLKTTYKFMYFREAKEYENSILFSIWVVINDAQEVCEGKAEKEITKGNWVETTEKSGPSVSYIPSIRNEKVNVNHLTNRVVETRRQAAKKISTTLSPIESRRRWCRSFHEKYKYVIKKTFTAINC